MVKLLISYHIIAFSLGVILDLIIGDPYYLPHPIRIIGTLISKLDKAFMDEAVITERKEKTEKIKGLICVIIVVLVTLLSTAFIIIAAYLIHPYLGIAIEAVITCYTLAAKSLETESMKVYSAIKSNDTEGARYAVSMIVGRDTEKLSKDGIIKAAVETVAENTSDGVIAPMLYLAIFGPIIGMTYKAVNTMDSMIGYHNDRYENFGKVAAKLDDIVNFIPSRISACFMIASSHIGSEFDHKNALKIFLRDRFNHKSPNSAQTESVCAGALNIQLAGDAYYFGKLVSKPFIGDKNRDIEAEDIRRVNKLMYMTMFLLFICCEVIMLILANVF